MNAAHVAAKRSALAVVVLLVAASCSSAPTSAPSPKPDVPTRGGRIVVALEQDFPSLNPLLLSDAYQIDPGGAVITQLYDSLIVPDRRTGELLPWLATAWHASDDGRTYDFELAANADWSDGRPIVGDDFVTAVKVALRSKAAYLTSALSARLEGADDYRTGKTTSIAGLTAAGKHLSLHLTAPPACPFVASLAFLPPLPTHVFAKYVSDTDPSVNADLAPDWLAPTVTSGPFTLGEWRHGEEIVLRANPRYWRGTPLLDELVFRVLVNVQLAAAFQRGSVDLAYRTPAAVDDVRDLERRGDVRVIRFPFNGYTSIGWNTRSSAVPGLREKAVRQALAYGLDVDVIVRDVLQGEGGRTRQHMSVGSWAYTSGLNDYPYDPVKAESLIRSAGYARGPDGIYQREGRALAFDLLAPQTDPVRTRLIQLAADQYRIIGVRATPKLDQTLLARLEAEDPSIDAFVVKFFWGADPNPASYWRSAPLAGAPSTRTGYVNPQLDQAIDAGRYVPGCGITARKTPYDSFNRILNEDQPANFLFWQNQFVVTSTRVRGVVPGTYLPLPDAHLWWVAPR